MRIQLVYATNSGGTGRASEIVAEVLTAKGHAVDVKYVTKANPDELANYDLNILATNSWDYHGKQGQVHEEFRKYIESAAGKTFENKPFAVLGLGDTSYMFFTGGATKLQEFVESLKGKLVMPVLRIDGFYFDQENNEALIRKWAEELADKITAGL